jgi:exosortase N
LAAGILDFTGKAALAKGNTIFYNGLDFDVDQACMGLNMLVSSMLVALLSLWIFEKKWQRRMPYHALPLILGVFFITNLLANLFRIILLVYFEIPPENWMHETIGIICWLVYGIIPGVAILRHLLKQWGGYERVIPVKKYPEPALRFYGLSQVGLFVVLSVLIHTTGLRSHYGENGPSLSRTDIPGFNKKKLEDGVTSFSNDQALIYIKPVRGFYSTDHNPAICWKGSGYAFHKIMATSIQATPVYQAELTKEGSRLHTAWWYESGSHRTNSQWVWRKDNFKNGMPYVLVNVTASTEKGLEVAVKNWMQQRDAVLSLQP